MKERANSHANKFYKKKSGKMTTFRALYKSAYGITSFFYFLSKTYVAGTQKNRLDETVLFENPKHMLKLMGKKIITIS